MTPSPLPEPLRVLRDAWLSVVRGPRQRAIVAAACLAATVAMLVSRMGTTPARLAALAILVVMAAIVTTLRVLEARVVVRSVHDPHRIPDEAQLALYETASLAA